MKKKYISGLLIVMVMVGIFASCKKKAEIDTNPPVDTAAESTEQETLSETQSTETEEIQTQEVYDTSDQEIETLEDNVSSPESNGSYTITEEVYTGDNINVRYPQFSGLGDPAVESELNQLFALGASNEDSWGENYSHTHDFEVTTQSEELVSILISGFYYTEGAAYPTTYRYGYNINPKTGAAVLLSEFADLNNLAETLYSGQGYQTLDIEKEYVDEHIQNQYPTQESLLALINEFNSSIYKSNFYIKDGKIILILDVIHALGDNTRILID